MPGSVNVYRSRTATKPSPRMISGFELLRLRADLRPFDVVLRQVAVQLRVALVAVVAPAGGEQEVHDVQAEAEVAGAGLLVEEAAGRDAADVAAAVDAGLELVRFDDDETVTGLDARRPSGRREPRRPRRREAAPQ